MDRQPYAHGHTQKRGEGRSRKADRKPYAHEHTPDSNAERLQPLERCATSAHFYVPPERVGTVSCLLFDWTIRQAQQRDLC